MKTLLLGDISPTQHIDPLFKVKDVKSLFDDTVSLFAGNDLSFVNLECAITEHDTGIKKFGPCLKACRETLEVLKDLGVNVCGLSNNHIFDFGRKGAADTIKALDELGLIHTGFGENYEDSRKNLYFEKDGEKIAIIAVCEHEYSYALDDRMGARPYDEYDTMSDIRAARKEADRVIVIYHGGKEHCRYPSPRLRKLCRAMAENGADVVLCQHSHCIGCYEEYEGCHILYGQGNFHFIYENCPPTWNGSLSVQYDTKTHEISFTPIVNTETGITFAKGDEAEEMMREFEKRNASLADGTWIDGWREFCERSRRQYYNATQSAYGVPSEEVGDSIFAHYIDCEAHLDVWKELFKTANHRNEK